MLFLLKIHRYFVEYKRIFSATERFSNEPIFTAFWIIIPALLRNRITLETIELKLKR